MVHLFCIAQLSDYPISLHLRVSQLFAPFNDRLSHKPLVLVHVAKFPLVFAHLLSLVLQSFLETFFCVQLIRKVSF